MPLFNSQIHWRGIGATVAVVLLTSLALALAIVSYLEWSSNAAVAEFMSATRHRHLIRTIPMSLRLRFSPSRAERRSKAAWFIWGGLLYPLPYIALALLPPVRKETAV